MQFFAPIKQSTLGIAVFAVATAALIAITQNTTEARIKDNERRQEAKALYQIIDREKIDNDLVEDSFELAAGTLGNRLASKGYRALNKGQVSAVILPVVAPDGYTGDISMIVGINADNSLAGVRVLAHKETPGLGDKIDLSKSDWILNFQGQSKAPGKDPAWAVKKDGGQFDQFTGATITPRAVVSATGRALEYFRKHRAELLLTDHKETKNGG